MAKIREGDIVTVTSGNYKGKSGKVIVVKKDDRCIVEGINKRKKAVKKQKPEDSGFMEVFSPIHISNVRVQVRHEDKDLAVKLKSRINEEGKKELCYKIDSKHFVYRTISSKGN